MAMISSMADLMSLVKRRGFIFPSSEIYGGLAGFFDYGPLGVELKKNLRDCWWCDMVQRRDDIVGLDCSIIMNPAVWKASGHVDGFTDPMVDCRESKMRFRADQLFYASVRVDGKIVGYVSILDGEGMEDEAQTLAEDLKRRLSIQGKMDPLELQCYLDCPAEIQPLIPSPATGKPGSLTAPRDFNLMFETHVGALRDDRSTAYLRPETAQGIFVNFRNILDTTRRKLPFGVAQIGRAFRNEITPRNFTFRCREFEQMEIEYFIAPEADWRAVYNQWVNQRLDWHRSLGLPADTLSLAVHPNAKLAHYSKACTDIMFRYPFGMQELEGIAARGNFDLDRHQQASGKTLEYFDESAHAHFLPHVIEPSLGLDRLFLAVLCAAYDEDEIDGERRLVLHLSRRIAPVKIAILPLVKNRPPIMDFATKLYDRLRSRWNSAFDSAGAIGRRYRRMDEIGTPYCVTVDFQTIEDQTVTVRDRDSTEQIRLHQNDLLAFFLEKLEGVTV